MAITKCPGKDSKVWNEKDIYDVECPKCNTAIEFWKDDKLKKCPGCGEEVKNPRFAEDEQ